jgi:hypothetical protein
MRAPVAPPLGGSTFPTATSSTRAGSSPARVYAARRTAESISSGRVSLKPPFFAYVCGGVSNAGTVWVAGGEADGRTFVMAVRTAAQMTTSLSALTRTLPLPRPVSWESLFVIADMVEEEEETEARVESNTSSDAGRTSGNSPAGSRAMCFSAPSSREHVLPSIT